MTNLEKRKMEQISLRELELDNYQEYIYSLDGFGDQYDGFSLNIIANENHIADCTISNVYHIWQLNQKIIDRISTNKKEGFSILDIDEEKKLYFDEYLNEIIISILEQHGWPNTQISTRSN